MKQWKQIVLAATMCGLLLAVLDTASASASVLCKEKPDFATGICSTKFGAYAKTQVFKASSTAATFTTVMGGEEKITCKSEMEFEATSEAGAEVTVSIKKLEFTGCFTDPNNEKCNLFTSETPTTAGIAATDDKGNGTMTLAGNLHVAYECPRNKCVVNLKGGHFSITGSATATFTALEVTTTAVMKPGWENCPKSTIYDDTLTQFSPKALWVGTSID